MTTKLYSRSASAPCAADALVISYRHLAENCIFRTLHLLLSRCRGPGPADPGRAMRSGRLSGAGGVAWQFPETLSKVQVVVLRDPSGEQEARFDLLHGATLISLRYRG